MIFKYILLAIFTLAASATLAVEVKELYQVELAVAAANPAARVGLTRQGMQEVILRVSGTNQTLEHEDIRAALKKADQYLQQFSYQMRQARNPNNDTVEQLVLQMHFDPTLINNLLRRARLPIWGHNRPNLLLWITIDDEQGRRIINAADESVLRQSIAEQARRRGLPVLFPLMDLDDESALSIVDAWALFKEPLQNASKRYQPEAILAGRLYRGADSQWTGRWQFMFNGQMEGFSASAPDLASYSEPAIDYVADQLGRYYAVNTDTADQGLVRFQVTGVDSLSTYAEVTQYLENLASVTSVQTKAVEQDILVLALTTEGDVEKLIEAIALDHKLIPLHKARETSAETALYYNWYKH